MSHTPKLPKELHPGFSTKAIPTCRVILDKNNPLTRGIKFACLFAQGFNNLATGKGPITNQLTFEGGRARQTSTNIIQYDRDDSGFDSELGTFALDMKGYSGNDFYARILEISGTEYQLLRQTDSEVGFNIGGSVVYFSGFDTIFGAGADTNIVARWDEANSSRKVTVNDKTVSDGTSFTVTNTSTDVYIFNRADGGRPSDASLSYFVIWDRFLTQRETDEFNAAPYQIFKPAIDITYFYQAAAAATTKLLKLPKEWHPGFSTKVKGGINPASPLAVDWSHPLSKGLARFMYITSGGLYDAVSGKLYKQDTDEAKVARINGLALDASSSYYFSLEETTYSASSSQTFTWLAAKDTADSVDGMIAGDSTDTGYFIWMNNTSANVLCRRFGTDTTLTISSIDNSDMTPRTWVHDVDGNEERLQADGSVATGTFNNNAFIENAVVRGYTGGSFNLDGKFHYYIVHEKALNRGEVEELQRNPFLLLKPAIDITYFTSTAGVGATTITTTLDAILKKTQSKTTTLDAILKQVQTLTTDLDSILKKTQTKTTTLDSTLQKTQTKTTTLDAVLEGGGTKTTTLDSILQKTQTKTTTLDSILQKTQSKTTTLDGILQKLQTKNTTLDSILKKTFELTTTLDAVLTTPGAKLITTNLDSILQKTIEVTTTVDAILRKTFSKTTSLDSYLKARKLLTTSIDAALKGTQSATITIDAILTSGEVWVVQANSSDIWTVQTNNSDTWTVV